jgi:hypothetical protein
LGGLHHNQAFSLEFDPYIVIGLANVPTSLHTVVVIARVEIHGPADVVKLSSRPKKGKREEGKRKKRKRKKIKRKKKK